MTKVSIFLALITETAVASHPARVHNRASPFDGEWRFEYSCEDATGIYAERCVTGQRDFLDFQLSAHGDKLCGTDAESAQLGNHADDGAEITGTIRGNVARVSWETLGSHGEGTMTVHGQTLVFRGGRWTADEGALWSFPPAETTTLKRNGEADPKLATCASPDSNAQS